MAPEGMRNLRRVLRYRNLLVQQSVRMKNKTAGLLMEVGAEYNERRLHGKKYFDSLLEGTDRYTGLRAADVELESRDDANLRAESTVDGGRVGPTPRAVRACGAAFDDRWGGRRHGAAWALEIGDPRRFASIKHAVSDCGLCSAQRESGGVSKRGPISKQRNKHLQRVLIEAAKLTPRWNTQLAAVYRHERDSGANPNQASMAVARKLVAYLLAVDKSGENFERRDAA